jgi:ABC-type iron transport system FetAB ATPase subunit
MNHLQIQSLSFVDRGPFELTVEGGECVCLTGPSGIGKTLLLRSIADLDCHGGQVLLDDVEARAIDAPTWRRRIGMLPAESQWWFDTVGEHFSDISEEWLGRLGFEEETLRWLVSRLSTGERQRLALLRLLCNRPRALLLDEPTASLDASNVGEVETIIREYRRARVAPVLWVTHDSEQAKRVADRRFEITRTGLIELS